MIASPALTCHDMTAMIEIRDLTFCYGGGPPVFKGFSLDIARGEAWSVIGPSGCGKTTLLYLLAGLRRPASGVIVIDEEPVLRPRPRTGLVLQDHGLLPWATVRENARLGLTVWEFYGSDGTHAPADWRRDRAGADRRVDSWLQKLGIAGLAGQYPSKLSRGQRQRTAIVRSLIMKPDLLLLDEPFSALDAPTREELQRVVTRLVKESGITSIIVTHDIEVAVTMGEKILVLREGANRSPRVLPNKCATLADRHHQPAFHNQCEELRQILGALACNAG